MKPNLVILVFVLVCSSVVAQNEAQQAANFLGKRAVSDTRTSALDSLFRSYRVYELEARAIKEFVINKKAESNLRLQLDNDYNWNLTLQPSHHPTSSATITLGTERGLEKVSLLPALQLKGILSNKITNSEVRLTIDDDFIYGFIRDGSSIYFIQPLRQFIKGSPRNEFVVYEKSQGYATTGAVCGVDDSNWKPTGPEKIRQKSSVVIQQELNYYTAVDYSIYQRLDFSVRDILNTMSGIINLVEGNFDNEFKDPFWVNGISPDTFYISTCPTCDPWTTSANAEDLLASFRDWGNKNTNCTDNGRLSQLWTNRDIFGIDNNGNQDSDVVGLAYRGETVCTKNGYQALQYFTPVADDLRNLVAHETGHNFNCRHDYEGDTPPCTPVPPAYIMAPAINGSNEWSHGAFPSACDKNSTATINGYYPDVDCLTLSYGYPLPGGDRWVDF